MTSIPVQLVGGGIDWPAWVQAVGSLIGIAIATAVPAWQRHKASEDARKAILTRASDAQVLGKKLIRIAEDRLTATLVGLHQKPVGASMNLLIRILEADIKVLEAFNLHQLETAKQMQAYSLVTGYLRSAADSLGFIKTFERVPKHHAEAIAGAKDTFPHMIASVQELEGWI